MKKVTIILPAYNEEASFPLLEQCMRKVLADNPGYRWEFLMVNDGSSDGTLDRMVHLHDADPEHWEYIDLSRNYGKEIAMMAGFDYAKGDAVIVMDTDMQHPVSAIPEMLKWWEEGYDDVFATRRSSGESTLKKWTSRAYYRTLQKLTRIPIQKDTGDFRLLDRSCVEAIKRMRETERNTKGIYSWIGFRKKGIFYDQLQRKEGKSKWSMRSLFNLAMNGFLSFTTAPLRIASILGISGAIFSILYLIYIIIRTLMYGEPVRGYPTIMVTMLLIGSLILLSLGIIGEYLARIFNEVKGRPGYFVRSKSASDNGRA